MAVVNRWYRILDILVAQHHVSVDDMRKMLGISPQTLQSSIEQLNDILDQDIQIRQKDNTLYLDVLDYARLEDILLGQLRKETDFNSSSKRVSYLIKRLLQTAQPLLIDDLAEDMGVSRSTINKDLKKVKQLSSDYQITITGTPNRGLEAEGKELNLRLFYIDNVYTYFESSHLKDETQLFLDQLRESYLLPKNTEDLLKKVLAITVSRINCQRFLSDEIPYFTNELRESEIMAKLIYHVELTYQISLSQYEQDFLSYPLNIQFIDGLDYHPSLSDHLKLIYQSMVDHVKEALDIDFDQDKLFQNLQTHFKFMINRLIFHAQANDIFHGEIRLKYPFAYEMSRVAVEKLQTYFKYQVAPSEISYLALYFELVLNERDLEQTALRPQIAVVCTTGRGTAAMISHQLTHVLGNDVEITQFSEESFNPQNDDNYFAIFTTIPLKLEQLKSPVIKISNLFDDQWLRDEWQKINAYHQSRLETVQLRFVKLSPGPSYLHYLETMCQLLADEGLVDSDFKRRILSREQRQSTIFSNAIAFPHAINQASRQTILMLGVLEETYKSDDDSVDFIFMVAISEQVDERTETELLDLYDDIFRIASDQSIKDELKLVETQEDFLDFAKSKGVF
ncbi:BglG family transcription antiterminator [Streptococcus tangpeifui]|uniref:BglG family transcription antiterminator n=1 Tax=Streptococcus tangpeifui TaxID=2709400 RepID=UPI0013ED6C36|nr:MULTISPECIES: PRD domain-containing protein [unclassified Streptococcus]